MFSLTTDERKVILFLIVTALIGIGVDFLAKKCPASSHVYNYDFTVEKLNLNKADKESLIGVRGIGEKLAQRIIEYREKNHGFREIEELKSIKGMNGSRYEKLKDYFTVE